uniref:Uncharacterized protein n=1 Tax=Nelumbo nucifera TaxID=4432 RepID=A0A822YF86_NELNU|nr:TPA_asm: hypothetical protein HUJ06_009664 [Nelumbo nucifera]
MFSANDSTTDFPTSPCLNFDAENSESAAFQLKERESGGGGGGGGEGV